MAFRLSWSLKAVEDLAEIRAFIAEDNPPAAQKTVEDIVRRVGLLVRFPEMGRVVPEFALHELRELVVKPYRIVYRLKAGEGSIEIVRAWHAARGQPEVG
ncbi:MAG: type II toxin-antitoxin system RelE/ParE family toxin [Verrucomicrobiia bacterium]